MVFIILLIKLIKSVLALNKSYEEKKKKIYHDNM